MITLWFEGRIFREGEIGPAGGPICCEARLEAVLELRRGDEARGLGDGGTEFKSGAILLLGTIWSLELFQKVVSSTEMFLAEF